ncbi:MAG TPA: PIG-L family deacetylase [Dehalococcoidia bacterium]|nr:PIG-L family deacetylase [Dehalococcoidia bacterium]
MENDYYMLVVTPHPDDAEFGVAGTVRKLTREGRKVVYVVCTNGDKGTSDRNMKPEDLVKTREKEQRAAARVLGVSKVEFMRYPDQGLEDTPEFRKALVRLIRRYRPQVVVTANPYIKYMWHRDHRITGQAVLDAVFPYARDHLSYPELLEEGLEPHKVREVWLWGPEDANHYSDITDTFDTKLQALGCHKSQVGDIPQEMRDRMRDWARTMAKGQNFELAEAFHRVMMRY